MTAKRQLTFSCAFFILSLYSTAFAETSFPSLDDILTDFYTTEATITDVYQESSAYVKEYYNNIDDQGSTKIYFQGELRSVYYDNTTYQIIDVVGSDCTVTDEDISDYDYQPIYHGWLNRKNPLIIGPSAPLWYAQTRRDDIKDESTETVRDISCDKYSLAVKNKLDDYTINYYFAPPDWTTPYSHENLRIPIRIHIKGNSTRFSEIAAPVDLITDFAYFRPTVVDEQELLPPIGIGCQSKKVTEDFPDIPSVFQYSAEVLNLIDAKEHDEVEVQFLTAWYDQSQKLARYDIFSRNKGFVSSLLDFNTGTVYRKSKGSCSMKTLRDAEFEIVDYGMTNRMMEPKEALNLDGDFYEMGKREIRSLTCDVYESVKLEEHFNGELYDRLVTTVYFTDTTTKVGVKGEEETQIPVYMLVTGYNDNEKKLEMQYNIFEFDDVIWPEMYDSFNLERCYNQPDSKAYFVLIMTVPPKIAAQMEDQDDRVTSGLRRAVATHAKVPEMRIPFLKVDYKPSGVFATGLMLERPPALIQFFEWLTGPTKTRDKFKKLIEKAKNEEQCAYACVDEGEFLCKGFFFCSGECFLKSIDPTDQSDDPELDIGYCTEYLRAEIDSTNYRQSYLNTALENLENAVFNKTISVAFELPGAEDIVIVNDIVIGEGPYTGADAGDKPFEVSVKARKLKTEFSTTRKMEYAGTLHDCYKECKRMGSMCSSFSFCPEAPKKQPECLISTELIIEGKTKANDLDDSRLDCNIYHLKYLDYFTEFKEKVSLLAGDKVIRSVDSLDNCAMNCRLEDSFKCRGFEYCRSEKACTLHTKHILDLKPGETGSSKEKKCVHYAARYIADYMDMGPVLIEDKSDVRYDASLEECAKICSEELSEKCKSFNYCPTDEYGKQSTCALTSKMLKDDGITTTEDFKCFHYEKRDNVHDWDNAKANSLSTGGYTKKGFAGLVIGMLVLGIIVGVIAFFGYSYMRSRSSGEGMAVRFMKSDA